MVLLGCIGEELEAEMCKHFFFLSSGKILTSFYANAHNSPARSNSCKPKVPAGAPLIDLQIEPRMVLLGCIGEELIQNVRHGA